MTDDARSDPRLNYLKQTGTEIKADYYDMPPGAQIVLVDQTSGKALSGGTPLDSGGSGKIVVAIDASTPPGAYHLEAQDAEGDEIAQSVEFYISKSEQGS